MLFLSVAKLESGRLIQNSSVGIELRLDQFPSVEINDVEEFIKTSPSPVLLTIRKGEFKGTEEERESLIEQLLTLEPPFFDLEYDMPAKFLTEMIKKHPQTKFILSYHNFERTPDNLEEIYRSMQKHPAFTYKIAAMARSANDALKMLLFAKSHPKTSAICMGEQGKFARVLGPVVGNLVNYACLDGEELAPGQLSLSEFEEIYGYCTQNTSIYGLIGDPIDKSKGHLYHNGVFRAQKRDAVYVKIAVKPEELSEFIPLASAMDFRGLSVTMPLKEEILPFLDEIEPKAKGIGAVNTLLFKEDKIVGTNTDGHGALDAIEKKTKVFGKKTILLGAGGAARAIAYEAKARGADLLILNRTVGRAMALANELGCAAGGLDEIPDQYEILINCSPELMPISSEKIQSGAIVMDIVYVPRDTPFLKEAASRGCQIVYGEEMFLNQAARQTAFWINR